MIRLIKNTILIFAVIFTAWFVINNDGQLVIDWLDYYIETSFLFFILLVFFVISVIIIIYNFFNSIRIFSGKLTRFSIKRELNHNIDLLKNSMCYFFTGHLDKSKRYILDLYENTKNSNSDTITGVCDVSLMIAAKIDLKQKNYPEAEEKLRKLYKFYPEFALLGLSRCKVGQQSYKEALLFAEEAYNKKFFNVSLFEDLYLIYKNLSNWSELENILHKAESLKIFSKSKLKEYFLEFYYSQLNDCNGKNDDKSIIILEDILRISPDDTDAAINLANLYKQLDDPKQSYKIIERNWRINPDKKLVEFIQNLFEDDANNIDCLIKMKKIIPAYAYTYVVIAEYFLETKQLEKGQAILAEYIDHNDHNADIILMMLKIKIYNSADNNELKGIFAKVKGR